MKGGLMSSPVLLLVNKDKKSDKNCLRSLERLTTKCNSNRCNGGFREFCHHEI